jgi:hypothetical protein
MTSIGKAGACVALAGILSGGTAHATDPVVKCQEQKLKAQGKLQFCLKKNSAKVLGGKPDAAAACQTKFSDALTKAGTVCRYLDNGDGTVTDLNTGLQWEKKDNLDSIVNLADPHDADNYYTWSVSGTAADGTAYTDFLAKVNNGASTDGGAHTPTGCFAGHCDWRLPNINEFRDIDDATQGLCGGGSGPCIDPAFGPTQANDYWSATTYPSSPGQVWATSFYNGFLSTNNKTINFYVRAVRGGL